MDIDCSRGARRTAPVAPSLKAEKRTRWCSEAEAALSDTLGDELDRANIIAAVNAGRMELWRLNEGQAWMVTGVAAGILTVNCFQGENVKEIAAFLYRIAQDNRLRAVDFWTMRPALARMLADFGLIQRETCYRCPVVRHEC